jgi:uncharacterized OsmC-like protein
MSEKEGFTVTLEQLGGFEYKVKWDWDTAPPLLTDEPTPLGRQLGPNASRLLAAAVGNCLTASLAFCLQRARVDVAGLRTSVTGTLARNERGRLRVGGIAVRIELPAAVEQAATALERCLKLFEDYCTVTASLRQGVPVSVEVVGSSGHALHTSGVA